MELQRKLIHAMLLWVIAAAAAASQTIKPDCQATCGDVSIPYPFGTREGCYLNDYFLVACNRSLSSPTPFLWSNISNLQLLNISIEDHRLRVYTFVGHDCYDEMGTQQVPFLSYANLPSFPFSTTGNKFTAVGCDTLAVMNGLNGADDFATGCLSLCDSIQSVTNGSCSGIGCCQTSNIPKGLLNYNATVVSFRNHTRVWPFNPCSYAFLAEEESFNFSSADLKDLQNRTVFPTLLDWAVGDKTCEEAKKNLTSYACKENSTCYDADNGPGYRCNCSSGYQGNPYLPNGCRDIDECADPNSNQCTKVCINTPGSYTCSCPKGNHGNGRKDENGDGCTPDQLLIVKIAVGISVGLIALLITSSWLYWGFKKRKFIKLKEKFFNFNKMEV